MGKGSRFEQAVKLAARKLGTRNRGDALMHIIDTFLAQAAGDFDNLLEDGDDTLNAILQDT